jgi:CopG family nickel-responsive transcriptional regulator
MNKIARFGVSIDEKLLKKFDSIIEDKGYVNRSEAIRDLIRDMMVSDSISDPDAEAIGTLTMIYSHDTREISDKLNDTQHHHFGSIISATHIHLDEHNCLEVIIMKGKAKTIQSISDKLLSIKNVRHGKVTITVAGKVLS